MTNAQTHQPKVSILIPVFNRKDYITECIQSALDQTFTDFEVVVVDNASDDGTWEICQQFADKDQRVRIFRNETNIGPVRNWIRCAQEAKGVLSKILFSDDCLESNCLSEMVPKMESPKVAFVYCAARIGKSRENSSIAYSQPNSLNVTPYQFLCLILSDNAPISPGAALLRTSDVLRNLHTTFPTVTQRQFEKNGAGPDAMILLLTAHSYPFLVNISTPLVFFRVHANSFTISDKSYEVMKGHQSTISLFINEKYDRGVLFKYLAQTWVWNIWLTRSWFNPNDHIIEYADEASLFEKYLFIYFVIIHFKKICIRKLKEYLNWH